MQINVTANGATAPFKFTSRRGNFAAYGSFGGGTVALQMSLDNGTTWWNVDRAGDTFVTFTANGEGGIEIPDCLLRVNVTGATNPSLTFKVN